MKAKVLVALGVILLAAVAGAEYRTFTNTEGRQVVAKLLALEGDSAVLRLQNGREAKVPLETLSNPDREFVRAWYDENKDKVTDRDVRLEIEKEDERLETKLGKGSRRTRTATTFRCTLSNVSRKKIEGIEAFCVTYKRSSSRSTGKGSNSDEEEFTETISVDPVGPQDEVEFTTAAVECEDFRERKVEGDRNRGRVKVSSSLKRESILGFVVELSKGGKTILKQSYPENFLDRLEEEEKRLEAREGS